MQKHRILIPFLRLFGCELLSFLYLWTIKSIFDRIRIIRGAVVNCFHFCIFELSKASLVLKSTEATMLWIAFIFVSLNYQKHPITDLLPTWFSCELLSFLYLWTIKSIIAPLGKYWRIVVNCFHFCIFELSKASGPQCESEAGSCELLSFLYLWTIKSIQGRGNGQ